MVKNCTQLHPVYFFNNMGVIHLKMKKYNLALVYFSKAMKFFNKNGEQNYLNGGNPSIFISNHTT
jgi:hypothetical protein